jgi:hypothetical protein
MGAINPQNKNPKNKKTPNNKPERTNLVDSPDASIET